VLLLRGIGAVQQQIAGGNFDAVIMTAAVADYRPAESVDGKIVSDKDQLTLQLVRNEKILPRLKAFASRPLFVVGFKLTVGADESARRGAVAAQFAGGGVDLVVQNDLAEIRVAPREKHPFQLFQNPTDAPMKILGANALARAIEARIAEAVPRVA
jgi:phosphopantothenoylcysteine decarboxylase/phosphopantothenate--cysteine ligase